MIVCAGLQADRLALASGEPAEPRIVPFRGEYWQLRADRAHLVRGLIYPVPDPALPFLGVHLTRKIDGTVVLGPNAILSTARDAYERRRFDLRDTYDAIRWPGTFRMLRRHWRAGVGELKRSASKRVFVSEVARYVPAVSRRRRRAGAPPASGPRRSIATARWSTTSASASAATWPGCGTRPPRPPPRAWRSPKSCSSARPEPARRGAEPVVLRSRLGRTTANAFGRLRR